MAIVEIEDHTDEAEEAMRQAVIMALEKCGLVAEGYAKRLAPVDTGNLRNSITHTTDGNVEYIGTNVEYAPYVELGTTRTRAQPYLRPAVQNHISEYERIIESEMMNA